MAKVTHKHRAVQKLEALGWTVGDVERMLRHTHQRIDLFGLFDLLAVRGTQTLGLQVTSPSNVAAHRDKMLDQPRLIDVLTAGWIVELWGVRNKSVGDGTFAVTRQFQLVNGGRQVAVYQTSSVLK